MSSFSPDNVRRDFPALEGIVFLNSASMGIPPLSAVCAVEAQLAHLRRGPAGVGWGEFVGNFEAPIALARAEAAKLLGAAEDEVGLVGDTTAGLHQAIEAIPFRSGDNIVLSDLEYPQVALAAENAAREGVEVRFVPHRAGIVGLDDYRAAIDARTRAVLVSSVGWVTGQRLDLAALCDLARRRGFFLVVDAVQQLGALSIDCGSLAIDFLTSGGYKWLNAPFGCGVFYVRRQTHERGLRVRRLGLLGLEEPEGGWSRFYDRPDMRPLPGMPPSRSARRFEAQGTPNRLGAAGFHASLLYRNGVDRAASERHVLDLAGELIDGLRSRGATLFTPPAAAERAGIVTFTFGAGARADRALVKFLSDRRVYVTARYCSGVGGLRAAVQYFNVRDEVAALLEAIDDFRGRR